MQQLLKLVVRHPEAFEASALPCCLRGLLEIAEPDARDPLEHAVRLNPDLSKRLDDRVRLRTGLRVSK